MLDLPDVTLCAIFTVCHGPSRLAVEECKRLVRFGDVQLFTDQPEMGDERYVEKFKDLTAAGHFTTYKAPRYFNTSHVLFIHWDSWVVNPSAWDKRFLDFDYIGAPWWYHDGLNVGNSGFCLRSKKLIDFLATHERDFPMGMPEDHVLCREYRKRLPQFRWADEDLAWMFSFERTYSPKHPPGETFGFHGMFNFPLVLSDDEIEARIDMCPEYVRSRVEYPQMRELMAVRSRRRISEGILCE